ncbi:hypothetical protein [Actinomadura algeriensis]|uniref:Uncharacterized protein n=1 Tax=Actinomadura algeriensis TaxID=1679523 RepID=A0ABR9K371_9ACTN|nr:hypothetical protein [Actinomadura algeriensis]MBE1537044.1 hypothetical protein [Actinomadura algeriensis]
MVMDERNPYLILGIPFGASRTAANIAFARRSRALRRSGARGGTAMTDLTWALNQIDEAVADPGAVLHIYRVPADPAAYTGGGILAPRPERLPARPGDRAAALAAARAAAAHECLRHLLGERAPSVPIPEP